MCYTGLFKRIIPFVLTFAVGLFIASFFVSIAFPGERWRNSRRFNKVREIQQLRIENEELREKLRQSRIENGELRRSADDWSTDELPLIPTVELDEHKPEPPAPPRKPKHPRVGIDQ